jgi:hypothetical protein
MKPTTWINWLGVTIFVPSFIALVVLCVKLTPPFSRTTDIDRLLPWSIVSALLAVVGLEMWMHRKKPSSGTN